ncbi:hypothetical protein NMY22_g16035 [Coprinellus aureogranulatus]|nr:hypothetical protein NMY22_g16035 [Coprinellus aureogranulatus]
MPASGLRRKHSSTHQKAQQHARSASGRRQKSKRPKPQRRSPPMEWPQYPNRGITLEEMRDIERRQHEYKAYHGSYPWESLFCALDDSETETEDSVEEGLQAEAKGHTYCAHSLEDEDILKAMYYFRPRHGVLQTVNGWEHPSCLSFFPIPGISNDTPFMPSNTYPLTFFDRNPPRDHPFATPREALSSVSTFHATGAVANQLDEVMTRLRPKDKLRKTERAQKIYRH